MAENSGLKVENVYNFLVNDLDIINEIANNIDNIIKNKDSSILENLAKEQIERLGISKTLIEKINGLNILDNYFYVHLDKIQKALEITDNMPLQLIEWANEILYNLSFDKIEIDFYRYLNTLELILHFYYEKNPQNEKEYTLKHVSLIIKSNSKDIKKDISIYLDNKLNMISTVENYLDILELANRLI